MKKISIHSVAIALLLLPHIALSQAVITEIMYDPAGVDSGHEWIEIYNVGTSSIPLADWKISTGNANHNIIGAFGGRALAPDAYVVIAQNISKFQSDHPGFSEQLFHSAFSLDNGGATIALRDKTLADVDTVSYDSAWGGLGDGNSLQRPPAQAGRPGDTGNLQPLGREVDPLDPQSRRFDLRDHDRTQGKSNYSEKDLQELKQGFQDERRSCDGSHGCIY